MKRWCLLLILVYSFGYSQTTTEYTVVRVVGKVESQALKRELKTNDRIQAKDQLKFGSRESYIFVTSPQTGRKKISGIPDTAPREFLQLLESFVRPEYKSTSTRGLSMQYLEILQNSLAFDTLLVLGDGFVEVNPHRLPLSPPATIKAWYNLNNKTTSRVISKEDGFFLNKSSLFESTSTRYPRVMVEYFDDGGSDPVFSPGLLLATFIPLYTDEDTLIMELKALIGGSASKDYASLFSEIKGYLASAYANAQENNLKTWLKKNNVLSE